MCERKLNASFVYATWAANIMQDLNLYTVFFITYVISMVFEINIYLRNMKITMRMLLTFRGSRKYFIQADQLTKSFAIKNYNG